MEIPAMAKSLILSRKSCTMTSFMPPHMREDGHDQDSHLPLYGSIMPYIMDDGSSLMVGMTRDSPHVAHIDYNALVSLVFNPVTPTIVPPSQLPLPRLNVMMPMEPLSDAVREHAADKFLKYHSGARPYVDNYVFYRAPYEKFAEILWRRGDGKENEMVDRDDFLNATADPLASTQRQILDLLNGQYALQLRFLCKEYAAVLPSSAIAYWADQEGLQVLAQPPNKSAWIDVRFPLPEPASSQEAFIDLMTAAFSCLPKA